MKLLNPLIVFEIEVMHPIIGVITIAQLQIAVKTPKELFKLVPHVVDLKLLNKEQRIIIIKQFMKILIGVLISDIDFENINSKIFVMLKFWISCGRFGSIPIDSKSFSVSCGIFCFILSISRLLYCSFKISCVLFSVSIPKQTRGRKFKNVKKNKKTANFFIKPFIFSSDFLNFKFVFYFKYISFSKVLIKLSNIGRLNKTIAIFPASSTLLEIEENPESLHVSDAIWVI